MPQSHVNISVDEAATGTPPLPPTTRATTAINNPRSPRSHSPVSSLNNNHIGAATTTTTTTTNGHSPSSSAETLTISCQWENYDGILTANAKGLVFTGSYFFFATILSLPWTDVRQMQYQHDDGAAPTTGLVVTMRNNKVEQEQEQQQHVFEGFPLTHLSRLMQLQNEALIALRLAATVLRDDLACTLSSSSSSSSSGSTMTSATSSRSTTPLPFRLDERVDDMVAEAVVDKNKNGPVTARASCHAGVTSSSSAPTATVARMSIITTAAERLPNAAIIELHTGLPLASRYVNVIHDDLQGRLYVGPKGLVFTGRRRNYYFWDDHALLVVPWSNIGRLHRPDAQTVLVQSSHHHHDAASSSQLLRDYRFFLMVDINTDENADDAAVQDEIWETLVSCHNAHLTETHGATSTMMAILTTPPPVSEIDRPGETTVAGGGEQKLVAEAAAPAQQTSIITADNTTLSKPLQHLVVSDVVVPCSLDRFEDLFLRNGATYSLGNFLASRGDSDVQSSNWDNDDDENNEEQRVVRYLHPVNVPMAPPQARARKEQRLVRRRWPSCPGDDDASTYIVVETKTIVDDVPMTDCFYVLDRLTVTEQKQGEDADSITNPMNVVQVRMEFEITFVKSTMFRGIIQKTTRQEFIGLFESLAEYYVHCLVDPAGPVPTQLAPVPGTTAQTAVTTTMESRSSRPNDDDNNNNRKSNSVTSPPPLHLLLWAVTCLLQLWILRELHELKKDRLDEMTVIKFD
jgi:hypothetical protein